MSPLVEPPGRSLRSKLLKRQPCVVLAGQALTSDTIDFVGQFGFDAVWLEAEHGPLTWDRIGDLSRAAELWGMAALVRLRGLEPGSPGRALSLGAHGIVLPQVESADVATQLVEECHFAPTGARGVARGRRSYGHGSYFESERGDIVVVVQIESVQGLARLDRICAVDGVDVVFVAPNDLAQSMGFIGRPDHPVVVEAVDGALARIARHGKSAGTVATPGAVDRLIDRGAQLLYVNTDQWLTVGARVLRDELLNRGASSAAS